MLLMAMCTTAAHRLPFALLGIRKRGRRKGRVALYLRSTVQFSDTACAEFALLRLHALCTQRIHTRKRKVQVYERSRMHPIESECRPSQHCNTSKRVFITQNSVENAQQSLDQHPTAFGNEAPCKTTIYNRFVKFKGGCVNLRNKLRDGRPTSVNNKNIDAPYDRNRQACDLP
ncbi:hypothetical protein EVAR_20354_1 [Eumeta japonica]|uniref:Uncharacterized protein n=1 Tax=Eumeta variegata TaxID=151549 RepID=A0A4C1VT97_EUMVA|nr:hypothetical protein EVAR_20354_1 [Eumeta japonica]